MVMMNYLYLIFWNVTDGSMAPEDTVFIITTNHPEVLDKALIRPGRMDIHINTGKCDKDQLCRIYRDLCGEYLDKDIIDRFIENKFIIAEIIMHIFHSKYKKNMILKIF